MIDKTIKFRFNEALDKILNKDILLSILIGLVIIIIGVGIGRYNNKVVPVNNDPHAHYSLEPSNPLSFMSDWDGPNYLKIATVGYSNLSQTNFFPVYPLLVHLIKPLIGALNSALLISWLCFILAIYFYLKIVKKLFEQTNNLEAARALAFFVFFPTAMFMLASYTEATFAFLALGSIYFALSRKYWIAGLMGLVATATHITGILLVILICLILIEQKAKISQIIRTFFISIMGLVAYMIYLAEKFHRPLAFIRAQKNHGWLASSYANIIKDADGFNIIFIVLLITAGIYWWNKRKSLAIYSLSFLLIPILGKEFGGFNRYVLMAFPIPLMFYSITKNHRTVYTAVLILSVIFWSYFLLQYTGGYVGG